MDREGKVRALRLAVTSWPVRLLLSGSALRLLLLPFAASGGWFLVALEIAASVLLAIGLAWAIWLLIVRLQRRLLWRVRRRLVLSYVFIGFVPVLLVVAFFSVAGTMSVLSTSAELVRRELDRVVGDTQVVVGAIGVRLSRGMDASEALARVRAVIGQRYDGLSVAALGPPGSGQLVAVGPWVHGAAPDRLPDWIAPDGFAGLVTTGPEDSLAIRAVAAVDLPDVRGIVVDIPLDDVVRQRIEAATGVAVDPFTAAPDDPAAALPFASSRGLAWVAFVDAAHWASGAVRTRSLPIHVPPSAFYARVFGAPADAGDVGVNDIFVLLLIGIGALFLVIEAAALVMGTALARSITGSVHALFTGTSRVRRGDFTHRITIPSRDQLGELAESFNAMTASVETLMHEVAEKKRLEEELRIARQIQMSLLPRDTVSIPGLTISALCRPAREVGGDYYEFIPLGGRRIGLLVADVAGKGASAALYMAELKGLILSLGQIYESPRTLLIETNRIMAGTLDARTFITMIYAVADLDAGTLTYARAGHTPLLYASANGAADAPGESAMDVHVLTPDGLVVGLAGLETQFDDLLEERRIDIHPGDVAVLFTDGVSEAMNEANDLFGETRLQQVIAAHGDLPPDALRDRIVQAIETFVGTADQHDDMTMVLLRIDAIGAAAGTDADVAVAAHGA